MSWAGLGCAAKVPICLPTFWDSQRGTARPLKHRTDGLFHNLVTNYQPTSRRVPEDRRLISLICYQIAVIFDNLQAVQVAKKFPAFLQNSPLLSPFLTHESNPFPNILFI